MTADARVSEAAWPDSPRERDFRAFTRLIRAVTAVTGVDDLIRLIVTAAPDLFGAGAAMLLVRGESRGLLMARSDDPAVQLHRIDLPLDETLHRYLAHELPQRLMAVPLLMRGRVLGVLAIGGLPREAPAAHHEWLASALADHAAVALTKLREDEMTVREIESETRDLREDEQRRQTVLSSLAHDLKTPLLTIRMGCHLLESSADQTTEDLRSTLEHMLIATEHLETMATNFMELGRLASGMTSVNCQSGDVREAIKQSLAIVQTRAAMQQVEFRSGEIAGRAWFDPSALRQVMVNLLGNAVKFSPPGASVSLVTMRSGDQVLIHVTDDGPGIAPHHLRHIFKPYYRGDADASATPGAGLGLAIVSRLVQMMHGRIEVQSKPGKGSTFSVCLRANPPD